MKIDNSKEKILERSQDAAYEIMRLISEKMNEYAAKGEATMPRYVFACVASSCLATLLEDSGVERVNGLLDEIKEKLNRDTEAVAASAVTHIVWGVPDKLN